MSWLALQQADVRLGAVPALRGVSLTVGPGERVAVVGANGSGKSTLLRTLHRLLPLERGRLHMAPDLRQAMVFQRPHMLRASAQFNVALGLWLDRRSGLRWAQARERAAQALARVGLLAQAGQNARELSGGQQQRLALARAWAREPQLWLLDEPTASLDPHAKREVEALMAEFARAPEVSLVWASHNLGQVKRLATRVIYLEHGQLLADLPTADFFDPFKLACVSPAAHAFVQGESA